MRYWDDDCAEWGAEERKFAAAWRGQPKWVVSRSLKSVGPNATLVENDVEGVIRGLKAELDGEIDVAGQTDRVPFSQSKYGLRCEWGPGGVQALGPVSDVVVIVDVLSFSTAVDVAVGRGAEVLPYRWKDESAAEFARAKGALLVARRGHGYSLSPASLRNIPAGAAIVLPSPNGAALALESRARVTFTACLRNCEAVARRAREAGSRIAVIPAGEQWSDGLRPCVEDYIGAGAVLAHLVGSLSPEAEMAEAAFERFRNRLGEALAACGSGRELIGRGFTEDVEMAAEYAVSRAVPRLMGDRFKTCGGFP